MSGLLLYKWVLFFSLVKVDVLNFLLLTPRAARTCNFMLKTSITMGFLTAVLSTRNIRIEPFLHSARS